MNPSQAERVLARLKQGPATSWDLQQLGICSHTARVSDLRKRKYIIIRTEQRKGTKRIVTYTLEGHSASMPAIEQKPTVLALQRSVKDNEATCCNLACQKVFEPDRKTQKYCSAKCRFEDWDRKNPRLNFPQASTSFPQDLPLTTGDSA